MPKPADPARTTSLPPEDATRVPDAIGTRSVDSPDATIGYVPEGLVVDGYTVLREIARGGMGRVLAARDLTLDREVAIKILLPGRSAAEAERRFVRESKITARLPHPGIPPIYALGQLPDGLPFLAMKLVHGRTLAEELLDRASPNADVPRFLGVFEQVCQAVGFAHSQGIIHRDLKPANVMVGAFGEVQVMDWGLAKERGEKPETPAAQNEPEDAGQTRSGAVMGTPAYMAPEQARGEIARLDSRSDVFSLGAILCEILTGGRPFLASSSMEVLRRAAAGDLADAFDRLDSCGADEELRAIAKQCLNRDALGRPADGAAVSRLIAMHRTGVEARLRKAETDRAAAAAEAREQRKRRRVQLALAAAILVMFGGAGAFAWHSEREATNKRTEEEIRFGAERERALENAAAVESLLERVEASLKNDDAGSASLALIEAERRMPGGGHERLVRCRRDYDMLVELDRIDDFRWESTNGVNSSSIFLGDPLQPFAGAVPALEALDAAFSKYGLTFGTPVEGNIRRIEESPIRERLLAALEWRFVYGAKADRPSRLAVLRTADPDPYRNSIREAWLRQNIEEFRRLFDEPDATRQPVRFAVVFAQRGELTKDRVWGILNACGQAQPRNFLLLIYAGSFSSGFTGMVNESISWYRAAVAVRPGNSAAWQGLGQSLAQRKDHAGAIVCLENAVRLSPNSGIAHGALGEQFVAKEEWVKAIAELKTAIRLNDRVPRYMLSLAEAQVKAGQREEGIQSYRLGVETAPTDAHTQFTAGWGLMNAGDPDGAAKAFRNLTRLTPNDPWAHGNLGIALMNKRDYAAAADAYREVVRLDPKSAKFRIEQGNILLAKGDVDEAVLAFEVALQLEPDSQPAKQGLARARKMKE